MVTHSKVRREEISFPTIRCYIVGFFFLQAYITFDDKAKDGDWGKKENEMQDHCIETSLKRSV